jgi:hypothetical protein
MAGTSLAQDHLVTLNMFSNMKVKNTPRLTIPNAKQQRTPTANWSIVASAPYHRKKQAKALWRLFEAQK